MMKELNGWLFEKNRYDLPATKSWIVFHPIYDGHHYADFDTLEEVKSFCTIDRFNEWSEALL